jgi:hypothetical protein
MGVRRNKAWMASYGNKEHNWRSVQESRTFLSSRKLHRSTLRTFQKNTQQMCIWAKVRLLALAAPSVASTMMKVQLEASKRHQAASTSYRRLPFEVRCREHELKMIL